MLVLGVLLVTLLVRPETLVGPVFLLAVLLSAWLCGMGPGLVAALLATLTIDYFFLPPKYTLRFNPAELPELLVFFVSAVAVSARNAIRNRTEMLLRRTRDELENRVQERTSELSRSNEQLTAEITERERVPAELRDSEGRFRMFVQFSFGAYWESDAQDRFTRQEFAEGLADAPAPGSEIGKTRWEVPYLDPGEEAWRQHRATLEAHLPFRHFELARPTPAGGDRYVRWPTKRRREWTGAWTFTARRSRSSRRSNPSRRFRRMALP